MTGPDQKKSLLALANASDRMAQAATSKEVARMHRRLATRYRADALKTSLDVPVPSKA